MDRKVAFLTVILFCCENTIMRGKCDIAKNNEIFWLSEDAIAMILNYSFPQSRCCNVCVNSSKLCVAFVFITIHYTFSEHM